MTSLICQVVFGVGVGCGCLGGCREGEEVEGEGGGGWVFCWVLGGGWRWWMGVGSLPTAKQEENTTPRTKGTITHPPSQKKEVNSAPKQERSGWSWRSCGVQVVR